MTRRLLLAVAEEAVRKLVSIGSEAGFELIAGPQAADLLG
jgi:hypothetical protein